MGLNDGERRPRNKRPEYSPEEHEWEDAFRKRGPAQPRIALGEDDSEMRRILADKLRDDGYEVIEAENGRQLIDVVAAALRHQDQVGFNLVVSDIRMPEMTGLEFLAELRKHDRNAPVILITAFGDAPTRAEAYRLGAGAVLDKPFELDEFRRLVRQFAPFEGGGPPTQET